MVFDLPALNTSIIPETVCTVEHCVSKSLFWLNTVVEVSSSSCAISNLISVGSPVAGHLCTSSKCLYCGFLLFCCPESRSLICRKYYSLRPIKSAPNSICSSPLAMRAYSCLLVMMISAICVQASKFLGRRPRQACR